MKKLFLLTKTLLVMTLLCVGANAWADDDFTSEVYSEDFSDTPEGVTYSMGGTNNTVSITNGYLDYYVATRTNGSPNLTFTDSNFSNLSEYKFVWDAAFGFGNTNATSLTLNADNTETKMFTIDFTGGGNTTKDITISKADGTAITPDVALTIAGKQAVGPWVTFTLFVHDSKAYLTVKSQDGNTTYINNVEVASAGHVSSITGSMGKGYNHINYDNLHLYKSASAVVVYKPSIAYSRVDGTKRYLTLTKDGNQEGDPTLYYRIGGEGDYTAYSEEFEVNSSATVYYYAELSGTSSPIGELDVTCEEITLNAPTVNVAYNPSTGKYNAYFVSSQTDKLITSDAVTYTYTTTSNSTPTACTSPVAVTVGETVTIYANASGYTSASTEKATVALPFTIPDNLAVWSDVFTTGETLTADDGATFSVGSTSNLVPITAIGATELSGNVGPSSYNTTRWSSTTSGLHPNANYYLGIKGLVSGQIVKIVVPEQTMLYGGISGRNNVSSSFYVDNGDGTFSFFCLAGSSSVAFNVNNRLYVRSVTAIGNAQIGSYGYASFSSTSALDFTSADVEAYIATACDGTNVTMTKVEGTVAANTGLVLKGDAGTYYIPVVAEGDAQDDNMLFALDGSYETLGAGTNGTNYVLGVQEINEVQTVVWAPVGSTPVPVTAGRSALFVPSNSARALRMVFPGDVITGVESVEAAAETAEKDGKFVENGMLVIKKNGKKFNAAGQQVK